MKGDFVGFEERRIETQRSEVCAGIFRIVVHGGQDVSLMIAVQTGYVFGTKQPERVARRRPQINLVAQGNDAVRSVFFINIRENGFGGQQIGMNIGDERNGFHRSS